MTRRFRIIFAGSNALFASASTISGSARALRYQLGSLTFIALFTRSSKYIRWQASVPASAQRTARSCRLHVHKKLNEHTRIGRHHLGIDLHAKTALEGDAMASVPFCLKTICRRLAGLRSSRQPVIAA